jgi:hypothetical protein
MEKIVLKKKTTSEVIIAGIHFERTHAVRKRMLESFKRILAMRTKTSAMRDNHRFFTVSVHSQRDSHFRTASAMASVTPASKISGTIFSVEGSFTHAERASAAAKHISSVIALARTSRAPRKIPEREHVIDLVRKVGRPVPTRRAWLPDRHDFRFGIRHRKTIAIEPCSSPCPASPGCRRTRR